jgi:hypothetical protein
MIPPFFDSAPPEWILMLLTLVFELPPLLPLFPLLLLPEDDVGVFDPAVGVGLQ